MDSPSLLQGSHNVAHHRNEPSARTRQAAELLPTPGPVSLDPVGRHETPARPESNIVTPP